MKPFRFVLWPVGLFVTTLIAFAVVNSLEVGTRVLVRSIGLNVNHLLSLVGLLSVIGFFVGIIVAVVIVIIRRRK